MTAQCDTCRDAGMWRVPGAQRRHMILLGVSGKATWRWQCCLKG